MIEGLKVTIGAAELQELCRQRADYHTERAQKYAEKVASMEADNIEGMNYTNGDPVRALKDKRDQHLNESAELTFYAEHLDPGEKYLLDASALNKLGITAKAW